LDGGYAGSVLALPRRGGSGNLNIVGSLPNASILGRYALFEELASGGMATVHLGRLLGSAGFTRPVAIKRLHPQFAKDPAFVAMFLDEARLTGGISHPNVVPTLDVVCREGEVFIVMEYVQGESLAHLLRAARALGEQAPVAVVSAILVSALNGLHAAHKAKDRSGNPLGIVHRDISPQNIMVGVDGIARVLDFGIAKAAGRSQQRTREGVIKGKLGYVAPEQIEGETVTARTDVYAAAVVLWEALAGRRLFDGSHDGHRIAKVLAGCSEPPSTWRPEVSPELDAITLRGLSIEPSGRFPTAADLARALQRAAAPASTHDVAEWVRRLAHEQLTGRARRLAELENSSTEPYSRVPPSGSAADTAVTVTELSGPRSMGRRPLAIPVAIAATALLVVAAGVRSYGATRAPRPTTDDRIVATTLAPQAPHSEFAAALPPPEALPPAEPSTIAPSTAAPSAGHPLAVAPPSDVSRARPAPPATSSTGTPSPRARAVPPRPTYRSLDGPNGVLNSRR
jgi:serine/threonine-protein kinase